MWVNEIIILCSVQRVLKGGKFSASPHHVWVQEVRNSGGLAGQMDQGFGQLHTHL